MALPDDYLRYPHRRYGMDQDRYDWRQSAKRGTIAWPNTAALALMLVVPIEHHPLDPPTTPFKHPGAMVTPYPDLRHYSSRDYGNRVGVFRILRALKTAGLRATFPINALQLDRLRPLVQAILADGHEIAAYGLSTCHIHWGGLDPETERQWIAEVRAAFDHAGLTPRAWLSPARSQSFTTPDLIAAAGFDLCLDWEMDSVPVPMRVSQGRLLALPLSNELDDRTLLIDRHQSEEDWAGQLAAATDYMTHEAPATGGQLLGVTLTPYVSGQPFRQYHLRQALARWSQDKAVWCATASEVAEAV